MNHVSRTVMSLLAALAPCVATSAQIAHPLPADRNAALRYTTAFYVELLKEITDKVDDADLNALGLESDPAKQPEKYKIAAQAVAERPSSVTSILNATALEKCDFEIAYDQGINALLSHLSPMRKAARLLRFDARRMLIDGKADEAADRIAAIYRMAGHLKSDEILISTLVSAAITSLGNSEVDVIIKSGKLTAAGREKIIAAIEHMGRKDPFGFKGALGGERRITIAWVRDHYQGPDAGKRLAELIKSEWGMKDLPKNLDQISKMDAESFAVALGQLETYHELLNSLWEMPDAVTQLEVLGSRCDKGDFGPFAAYFAPSLSKARASAAKNEGELTRTRERLAGYSAPALAK